MSEPALFGVILPAAGSGSRFGGDKLSIHVAGKPVLRWAIEAFAAREDVAEVVVVGPESRRELAGESVLWCEGGATRDASVRRGLDVLAKLPQPPTFVAIHDAARPGVSQPLIDRVFAAAIERGAAIPGVALVDTIARVRDGTVVDQPPRDELVAVQTPQVARLAWLVDAFARLPAGVAVTDDASVLRAAGYDVAVVLGDAANAKITHADDLDRMARWLESTDAPPPPPAAG